MRSHLLLKIFRLEFDLLTLQFDCDFYTNLLTYLLTYVSLFLFDNTSELAGGDRCTLL